MPEHGKASTYNHHKCRCKSCTKANSEVHSNRKKKRAWKSIPDHVHGTLNGYNYYQCRCDKCSESVKKYKRSKRST